MRRLTLLYLLVLPGLAHATPRFELEQLTVDGEVQRVEAVDLDGDGKRDLLVAVVRGKGASAVRELDVFWNLGGKYAARPDLALPVEPELCAYDVASLDGGPASSLLAITPGGVRARGFSDRQAQPWRTLLAQPTLFPRAPREQLSRFRLAQHLGMPAPALLVPGLGTLAVYLREHDAFVLKSTLELDVEVSVDVPHRLEGSSEAGLRAFGVTARAPAVELADVDGDGRLDLVLVRGDELRVFLQGPGGLFKSKPSFVRAFNVRTAQEEKEGKDRDLHVQLVDVDGDKRADVVFTKQVSAGITSATTTVSIFRGTPTGFGAVPDQQLKTDGASLTGVQLADLTGDGRPDLIIPSVKIGLFAIIRMLTSKKLKVNFQLYPWGSVQKNFALKPTVERSLVFDLDLSGKSSDAQILDLHGDYDGDGKVDFAFGTGEEELSLYSGGQPGALFSDEAFVQLRVRAYGSALATDLDGKNRSDLVLWYSGTPGHKHELAVEHNRGL